MSDNKHPTEQSFLADVRDHKMFVIRDDGRYRHVRFQKPGTSCMHFDLITWPGYLCYCGDMGTYVFSRLEDMFEFFRTDRWQPSRDGRTLFINLGYWSEKLQAVDGQRSGGTAKEFDKDRFECVINEYRLRWIREYRDKLSKDERRELWEAVRDDVISRLDDGEYAAQQAAHDFSHSVKGIRHFEFTDLWDHDFTDYTYRFVWCCYAMAWGIQQYDNTRAQVQGTKGLENV